MLITPAKEVSEQVQSVLTNYPKVIKTVMNPGRKDFSMQTRSRVLAVFRHLDTPQPGKNTDELQAALLAHIRIGTIPEQCEKAVLNLITDLVKEYQKNLQNTGRYDGPAYPATLKETPGPLQTTVLFYSYMALFPFATNSDATTDMLKDLIGFLKKPNKVF